MSNVPPIPPRSPKRTTPRRTPLQERSKSQTNILSPRFATSPDSQSPQSSLFGPTPFPTKAEHILRPSTIRKQSGGQSAISEYFSSSTTDFSTRRNAKLNDAAGVGQRPAVRLKRSVKDLRNLYEAQAEEVSRPSTAATRPGTAVSRGRSLSSSDGLVGKLPWEQRFPPVTADDLAILPPLPSRERSPIKPVGSIASFASRAAALDPPSSPNYEIIDITSSPQISVYKDDTSPISTQPPADVSSSPNIVRHGRSSSTGEQSVVEQSSSSPNVIKLGSSSPTNITSNMSSSPSAVETSPSQAPKGRKRSHSETGFWFGSKNVTYPSSPPHMQSPQSGAIMSSPNVDSIASASTQDKSVISDRVDDSSPPWRAISHEDDSIMEGKSVSTTHASLQAALSSSSPPAIQYPIVRAPNASQKAGLVIPKRQSRSTTTEVLSPRWISRLSAVPSEGSGEKSLKSSKRSSFVEDLREARRPITAASAISMDEPHPFAGSNQPHNNSQDRIISEHDHHEASDEISALPGGEYMFKSPPLRPKWSGGLSSSSSSSLPRISSVRNSMDHRLNPMRSFSRSRQNSLLSGSKRPGSSGSTMTQVALPTWARRYYSGIYPDSFQYLSHTKSHNLSTHDLSLQIHSNAVSRPETAKTRGSRPRSWMSFKDSLNEYVPSLIRPKRKRMTAHMSHTLPGFGPLVSNPVTAADGTLILNNPPDQFSSPSIGRHSGRTNSTMLSPADPRAHWAGIAEDKLAEMHSNGHYGYHSRMSSRLSSSYGGSVIRHGQYPGSMRNGAMSPHLHHDQRLNTGSSVSRGYGFPFNMRSRYHAPSLIDMPNNGRLHLDARNVQVSLFMIGFIIPLTWFVAALLSLPQRPGMYADIEKAELDRYVVEVNQWEDMDVVAKLRLQRHLKGLEELRWQNTRWWRRTNRYMCIIGAALMIVMIVLAVVGSRSNWR